MSPTDVRNLLVELQVEELPPKALKKLGEAFAASLHDGLVQRGLATPEAARTVHATPRRLGLHLTGVQAKAADRSVAHKLMPAAVGLAADGSATPALLKKLAALGAGPQDVPRLVRRLDGKAETLFLEGTQTGATLAEGLQAALDEAIAALPIPKVMTYQLADGWSSVKFVRPVHTLVALHGAEVVPVAAFGLQAGRRTQGHRFETRTPELDIRSADDYAPQLAEEGRVISGFEARRAEIQRQLQAAGAAAGLTPIDDAALLDEVTALVERPNVLTAQFEPEFLAVPQECLILTMKANQKYFPLLDAQGKLTHRFLVVSAIAPADPSRIIEGNERVVRPRLADAKFFFDQDRKRPLSERVEGLAKVVYHGKLGTQAERNERVRAIARQLAPALGDATLTAQADEAARLSKADLLTDMVGEFPELQGTMGAYYARHDGLPEPVAEAIEDHYRPRFAGDALPRNAVGLVVALADKLETLAGLFGIGQVPTGEKDPFALRRHALGVVRMLIERAWPQPVAAVLDAAWSAFPQADAAARTALRQFIEERLAGYLRERGHPAADIDAVLAGGVQAWAELPKRLDAVRAFRALPEAEALASANKRVGNILRKSEAPVADAVDAARLVEPAEQALWQALSATAPQADAAYDAGDYTASLQRLAALKQPVDAFFDAVMVNADDAALRANRLALLALLHRAMNRVADLSRLAA